MNLANWQFRLSKGDLKHLPREFVLAAPLAPLGWVEIDIISAVP